MKKITQKKSNLKLLVESIAKNMSTEGSYGNIGDGKIDDAFNITSPRIKKNGEAFDYDRYGTMYAERQPISIDGIDGIALADHWVTGAIREFIGKSSDVNRYYLFFNGSKVGTQQKIEREFGKKLCDSDSLHAELLCFDTEKELLEAFDKLNAYGAFDTDVEWSYAKSE